MNNKPTLLSINNYYYRRGGAEAVFFDHNLIFEGMGWDVIPFAMAHENNYDSPWSDYFIDEIEYGSHYSLPRKIASAGKIIYSTESRKKVSALVAKTRPSLAHAHNIYHHISPSIFSKLKGMGVPTVLTLHDLKLACPAYKMLQKDSVCERCKNGNLLNVVIHRCIKSSFFLSSLIYLESILHKLLSSYSKCVDQFVVPSRFYIDKFVEWGWPREKFAYIPNFVNADKLLPVYSGGEGFIYIGRLAPEKGLKTFIKAVAKAGVRGRIVGEGPESESLKQIALDCNADIEFMGYRSGKALYDAIRSSRVVVVPSEWYENAPISLLESYALGKPVLGARIGGIPELIKEDETGWIFESGNVDDLAHWLDVIEKLSDTQISEMGKNARCWVESNFTVNNYRENTLKLYKKLGVDV
ncbi:glycosyltransferase family 4 protein [Pseudomonadota bacterium]